MLALLVIWNLNSLALLYKSLIFSRLFTVYNNIVFEYNDGDLEEGIFHVELILFFI